jgi:hypothetical protein
MQATTLLITSDKTWVSLGNDNHGTHHESGCIAKPIKSAMVITRILGKNWHLNSDHYIHDT